jgi:hypothetical protein
MSESEYLSRQETNATDDIEIIVVHLAYQWRDIPLEMLRNNVYKACVDTKEWSHCKPLSRETGIACVPD